MAWTFFRTSVNGRTVTYREGDVVSDQDAVSRGLVLGAVRLPDGG